MKKRMLSMLMATSLMFTTSPTVFAANASGLQEKINGAQDGVVNLDRDYTITQTVNIPNGVTINGNDHTITYQGNGKAMSITANAPVRFNNLNIEAKNDGAYAIDLISKQPDLYLDSCVISVDTRGVNMYPVEGSTNSKLTLDKTTIQNTDVVGSYADNTTVGDTRGIALFDVKNSKITLKDSNIYGFGYSINTSAPQDDDKTRAGSNTFDITNSDIWGWSAVNIWTVGNEFNFTNCDLRGINPLNTVGNSFSVVVLNNGIYGANPTNIAPNIIHLIGGTIDANTVQNTIAVEENIATIENQFMSEFHFSKYNGKKVKMTCDKAFSAITYDATGTDGLDAEFASWAASNKLTGPENASYNQGSTSIFYPDRGLIAPGIYAGKTKPVVSMQNEQVTPVSFGTTYHIGGALE